MILVQIYSLDNGITSTKEFFLCFSDFAVEAVDCSQNFVTNQNIFLVIKYDRTFFCLQMELVIANRWVPEFYVRYNQFCYNLGLQLTSSNLGLNRGVTYNSKNKRIY